MPRSLQSCGHTRAYTHRAAPPEGFTLLELLVVVTLITTLAALLLPALTQARRRANDVACLCNLRQWGVATATYASENDDLLPKDGSPNGLSTAEGWYIDLPRTLGLPTYPDLPWRTNASLPPPRSIWICPTTTRRSNGKNLFHYCLNEHINGAGSGQQRPLASVPYPAAAVWLFDNGKLAPVAQQNNVHTNLHLGGAQFLFLDGHTARFQASAYWDFARNRGKTNNPELQWQQ